MVQTKSITFGNFSLNNLVFILFKVSSAFSFLKGKIFYIKVQFTSIAFIIQVLTNAHVHKDRSYSCYNFGLLTIEREKLWGHVEAIHRDRGFNLTGVQRKIGSSVSTYLITQNYCGWGVS